MSSRHARRAAHLLMAVGSTLLLVACGGSESPPPAADAPARPASTASAQPAAPPVAAAPSAPTAAAPAAAQAARPASAAAQPTVTRMAKEIFASRCVTCHGAKGKGDGAGSVGLVPAPRDLTDPAWQATVTDEYLEKIIAYGGMAVGKSPGMPPNPDLMAKKEVVAELRAMVRALAKK